jgi:hypothetical protein
VTAWSLEAPLGESVYPGGTIVQLEAIDPTTRAQVTGVTVSNIALYGYDASGITADVELPDVWPLYSPQDVADESDGA